MKIFKLVNNRTEIIELETQGLWVNDQGEEVLRVKNEFGNHIQLFERELNEYLYFTSIEKAITVLVQEHCSRIISLNEERWNKTLELREALNRILDVTSVDIRNNALISAFELYSEEADILIEGSDRTIRDAYMDVLRNNSITETNS